MQREIKSLRKFIYGTLSNPDISDIPDEAAVASSNLDGDGIEGELRAIPAHTLFKSSLGKLYNGTWLYEQVSDNWVWLAFNKASHTIQYINDFYGTPSSLTNLPNSLTPSGIYSSSFVTKNRATHIAVSDNASLTANSSSVPQWVGWINNLKWSCVRTRTAGTGKDDIVVSDYITDTASTITVQIVASAAATGSGEFTNGSDGLIIDTGGTAHGLVAGNSILITLYYSEDNHGVITPVTVTYTDTVGSVPSSSTFVLTGEYVSYDTGSGHNCTWSYAASGTTFKSKVDTGGGGTWSADTAVVQGKEYDVGSGMKIKFLSDLGYTAGDTWTFNTVVSNTYTLSNEQAPLSNYVDSGYFSFAAAPLVIDDTNANFTPDKKYFYAYSLIYDGYQESPLAKPSDWTFVSSNNLASALLTLTFTGTISDRITAINIYKADAELDATEPGTLYHLVSSAALAGNRWSKSGSTYTLKVNDEGTIGPSFDDSAGLSETLQDFSVNYVLNTEVNGYHFVGKCWHKDIPDAPYMIFRSKQGRYDMFDWSQDILHLPNIPTAMASYAGRLYVFDEANTYKINPDGMYIEDIFHGVGCYGQRSVIVTNYGMFLADANGIYINDGNNILPISDPIKHSEIGQVFSALASTYPGYIESAKTTFEPVLTFNAVNHYLMVNMYSASGSYLTTWAYHIVKKRWDYWTYDQSNIKASANTGFITGKNGEIYFSSDNSSLYLMFDPNSSSSYSWTFVSKRLDVDTLSQQKQINKIIYSGTLTSSKYGSNGSIPTTTTFTSGTYINQYMKSIQLYLAGTSNLYGVDILYRRMVGAR